MAVVWILQPSVLFSTMDVSHSKSNCALSLRFFTNTNTCFLHMDYKWLNYISDPQVPSTNGWVHKIMQHQVSHRVWGCGYGRRLCMKTCTCKVNCEGYKGKSSNIWWCNYVLFTSTGTEDWGQLLVNESEAGSIHSGNMHAHPIRAHTPICRGIPPSYH